MKWIEFKSTVQFESLGRNKGPVFEAGSRHELDDDFADRWIRRGVAIAAEAPSVETANEQPAQDGATPQDGTPPSESAGEGAKANPRRSKGAVPQA